MAVSTGVEFFDKIMSSLNLSNPITLGLNIILSTLIGGIVFLIVVKLISKSFHENAKSWHAFVVVFVINLINMFGLINLVPVISAAPAFVIQVIIWIVLSKLAFMDLSFKHAIVVGIVGFIVSMLILPYLVGIASYYLPR